MNISGYLSVQTFEDHLKKDSVKPVYLVYGEERFFQASILEVLKKEVFGDTGGVALNYHQFYGTENTLSEVLSACLGFPMLSDKKMVVVKDFGKLAGSEQETFRKYIENPHLHTVLVLITDKLQNTKIYKTLQQHAELINCRLLTGDDLYRWVRNRFSETGRTIENEAVVFLIENIGNNLLRLNFEIDKILDYRSDSGEIRLDDIAEISGFTREVNIFSLQKALGSKDLEQSLRLGIYLLEQGQVLAAMIPMLFIYFRRMWVVGRLVRQNMSREQILGRLKGNPYAYRDVFACFSNFTDSQLTGILAHLEKADLELKTSQKDEKSIFSMICLQVCGDIKK